MPAVSSIARHAPFALYVLLAVLVGGWIIDDAGISYAYARSLARGYGFVSQPGVPPVEGFSNFLWVLALSPFMLVRVFHPVVVPKIVSAAMVWVTFRMIQRSLRRETGSDGPGWFASIALAIAPPIVIWTMSGLENALTLLLGTAFALQLANRSDRWEIKAGVLSALLAMTHPELILLWGTGLLVCLADPPRRWRSLLTYGASFAVPTAAFIAFRFAAFGLLLPHTYYAKRIDASVWERLASLIRDPRALWDRIVDLVQGLGGFAGVVMIVFMLIAAAVLVSRRRLTRPIAVWLLLALNAIGAYLWMDEDWMGEYRFAPVIILAVVVTVARAGEAL